MIKIFYILDKKLKSNQGSIILESAIIFPIVIVILLCIISATIVLYDHYVTEVSVIVMHTVTEDSINMNEMANNSQLEKILGEVRIGSFEQLILEEQSEGKSLVFYREKGKIRVIDNTEYPFFSSSFFVREHDAYVMNLNMMSLIYKIELVSDVFETVEITQKTKDKYIETLDAIFGALESY